MTLPFVYSENVTLTKCLHCRLRLTHKGARASVLLSANCWLLPYVCMYACVCVCVCVCKLWPKRFVWASVGSAGHFSIPSFRANIIQFPRILQPLPSLLHTHVHTHTNRYTQPMLDTHTIYNIHTNHWCCV